MKFAKPPNYIDRQIFQLYGKSNPLACLLGCVHSGFVTKVISSHTLSHFERLVIPVRLSRKKSFVVVYSENIMYETSMF